MAWPVSPTNGQQTTIANVLYQYNSSLGVWTKVQLAQPPYISDGNNVTISGNLTIPGTMSAASFSVANIAVGNITASGNITAVRFNGNVVGNLTGTASNATFATLSATANTVAGANVTGQVPFAATANSVNGGNVIGQVNFAATANSVAGANVTGTVANATFSTSAGTAGTVTTNAQPNITSVGTLTSLTISGNLTAGNISGNIISGSNPISTTGNATVGNLNTSGIVGGAAATLFGTTLTTGANTTAGSITGNWTLTTGSRLQATYADLAEYYRADKHYEPGTVLEFGGEFEVTLAEDETTRVAGVVSTNPAMAMNSTCPGEAVAIALQGRVPCKVRGTIRKGDMLVSGGNGYARPAITPKLGTIIGKALQDYEGSDGIIEVVVGRL